MFCPSCGLEDRNSNQYCRACGTDLRPVRVAVEKPDNITASAISARDHIGQAIADKIRAAQSARDLVIFSEDVLPQIEKFLESPAERRLRRIRTGTLISLIGMGVAVAFLLASTVDEKFFPIAGLGLVTFFIGLSFVINGLLFTVPKNQLSDNSVEADSQRELDQVTNDLSLPEPKQVFTSVTDSTTRHLDEKQPILRNE